MDDQHRRRAAAAREAGSGPGAADLVRPATLSAMAKDAILARIVTGDIVAGRVYSAPALAVVLGVSPTPVREALLELASAGLLEAVPNKGYRIVDVTQDDLDEILEVRLMLEVPATAEVARRGTAADQLPRFRQLAGDIERHAENGDMPSFLEADRKFHLGLLGTLGNSRIIETVSRLRDQARLYGLAELAERGELRESAHEHEKLLDAISADDPAATAAVMAHHLRHTRGIWAGKTEQPG